MFVKDYMKESIIVYVDCQAGKRIYLVKSKVPGQVGQLGRLSEDGLCILKEGKRVFN